MTLAVSVPVPHLLIERELLAGGARIVVGMDEVGRGALAGPVSVGVVAVDAQTPEGPRGVADSKLLTPAARTALLPALATWGVARAVGHASAAEIDRFGIIGALRLAGRRALAGLAIPVDVVLLDGKHDWLTPPAQAGFFDADADVDADADADADAADDLAAGFAAVVHTRVKADLTCASVAAASVLAKCERDALMCALSAEHPAYGWSGNKGYGSPDHLAALRALGPSPLHRMSWRLPLE
jgi:ribonuclease HII